MTINYWLFVGATLALLAFLGYGTFATARLLRHWQPTHNLLLMPAENVVRVVLIVATVLLGQLSGVGTAALGWQITAFWPQLLNGIMWGGLLAGFFIWSTHWLLTHGGARYYSAVIINAIVPRNRRELLLVLLAMGPVVLLEELLFRSLLIGGLQLVVPAWVLLLGWSVIFGLLHSPQGRWGMMGAGLAGLLLGGLFLASESLLPPLAAHYVANSVQLVQAMRLGYGRRSAV
jgi:membrane protease YdiL (CAAX protease family)